MTSMTKIRCWQAAALLAVLHSGLVACQDAPVDLGEPEEAVPPPAPPVELPAGAVIELGSEAAPARSVEGFSLPERVGARVASWSEGELSTIRFDVRGGAKNYLVTFLAEPYHRLGQVPVSLSLNQRPLADTTLTDGWRGYRFVVAGDRIRAGRNELAFHYAKTGRPSDFDPASSDVRSLSARFDQVQVQPIGERVELAFSSKNASALATLGDGWARDPSDRGTGTWTVAPRAQITVNIREAEPAAKASAFMLSLTARSPRGVAERRVKLALNGAPLGELTFGEQKATVELEVPAQRVKAENEVALEFSQLKSPAELDASSKDRRPLGLRVFELVLEPRESVPAPAPPAPAARVQPTRRASAREANLK